MKNEPKEESKETKTISRFIKTDGTLQFESSRPVDQVLKLAEEKIAVKRDMQSGANTPESMGSPMSFAPEEEVFDYMKPINTVLHADNE